MPSPDVWIAPYSERNGITSTHVSLSIARFTRSLYSCGVSSSLSENTATSGAIEIFEVPPAPNSLTGWNPERSMVKPFLNWLKTNATRQASANKKSVVFIIAENVCSHAAANSAPSVASKAMCVTTTAAHPISTAGIHFALRFRNARKFATGNFSGTGQPAAGIHMPETFTNEAPFRYVL